MQTFSVGVLAQEASRSANIGESVEDSIRESGLIECPKTFSFMNNVLTVGKLKCDNVLKVIGPVRRDFGIISLDFLTSDKESQCVVGNKAAKLPPSTRAYYACPDKIQGGSSIFLECNSKRLSAFNLRSRAAEVRQDQFFWQTWYTSDKEEQAKQLELQANRLENDALALCSSLAKADSGSVLAYFGLSLTYLQQGNCKQAFEVANNGRKILDKSNEEMLEVVNNLMAQASSCEELDFVKKKADYEDKWFSGTRTFLGLLEDPVYEVKEHKTKSKEEAQSLMRAHLSGKLKGMNTLVEQTKSEVDESLSSGEKGKLMLKQDMGLDLGWALPIMFQSAGKSVKALTSYIPFIGEGYSDRGLNNYLGEAARVNDEALALKTVLDLDKRGIIDLTNLDAVTYEDLNRFAKGNSRIVAQFRNQIEIVKRSDLYKSLELTRVGEEYSLKVRGTDLDRLKDDSEFAFEHWTTEILAPSAATMGIMMGGSWVIGKTTQAVAARFPVAAARVGGSRWLAPFEWGNKVGNLINKRVYTLSKGIGLENVPIISARRVANLAQFWGEELVYEEVLLNTLYMGGGDVAEVLSGLKRGRFRISTNIFDKQRGITKYTSVLDQTDLQNSLTELQSQGFTLAERIEPGGKLEAFKVVNNKGLLEVVGVQGSNFDKGIENIKVQSEKAASIKNSESIVAVNEVSKASDLSESSDIYVSLKTSQEVESGSVQVIKQNGEVVGISYVEKETVKGVEKNQKVILKQGVKLTNVNVDGKTLQIESIKSAEEFVEEAINEIKNDPTLQKAINEKKVKISDVFRPGSWTKEMGTNGAIFEIVEEISNDINHKSSVAVLKKMKAYGLVDDSYNPKFKNKALQDYVQKAKLGIASTKQDIEEATFGVLEKLNQDKKVLEEYFGKENYDIEIIGKDSRLSENTRKILGKLPKDTPKASLKILYLQLNQEIVAHQTNLLAAIDIADSVEGTPERVKAAVEEPTEKKIIPLQIFKSNAEIRKLFANPEVANALLALKEVSIIIMSQDIVDPSVPLSNYLSEAQIKVVNDLKARGVDMLSIAQEISREGIEESEASYKLNRLTTKRLVTSSIFKETGFNEREQLLQNLLNTPTEFPQILESFIEKGGTVEEVVFLNLQIKTISNLIPPIVEEEISKLERAGKLSYSEQELHDKVDLIVHDIKGPFSAYVGLVILFNNNLKEELTGIVEEDSSIDTSLPDLVRKEKLRQLILKKFKAFEGRDAEKEVEDILYAGLTEANILEFADVGTGREFDEEGNLFPTNKIKATVQIDSEGVPHVIFWTNNRIHHEVALAEFISGELGKDIKLGKYPLDLLRNVGLYEIYQDRQTGRIIDIRMEGGILQLEQKRLSVGVLTRKTDEALLASISTGLMSEKLLEKIGTSNNEKGYYIETPQGMKIEETQPAGIDAGIRTQAESRMKELGFTSKAEVFEKLDILTRLNPSVAELARDSQTLASMAIIYDSSVEVSFVGYADPRYNAKDENGEYIYPEVREKARISGKAGFNVVYYAENYIAEEKLVGEVAAAIDSGKSATEALEESLGESLRPGKKDSFGISSAFGEGLARHTGPLTALAQAIKQGSSMHEVAMDINFWNPNARLGGAHSDNMIKIMGKLAKENNVRLTVHGPIFDALGSLMPGLNAENNEMLAVYKEAVDTAEALGSESVVMHLVDPSNVELIKSVISHAEGKNVKIVIENTHKKGIYHSSEEFLQGIENVVKENPGEFGVLIDVAHLSIGVVGRDPQINAIVDKISDAKTKKADQELIDTFEREKIELIEQRKEELQAKVMQELEQITGGVESINIKYGTRLKVLELHINQNWGVEGPFGVADSHRAIGEEGVVPNGMAIERLIRENPELVVISEQSTRITEKDSEVILGVLEPKGLVQVSITSPTEGGLERALSRETSLSSTPAIEELVELKESISKKFEAKGMSKSLENLIGKVSSTPEKSLGEYVTDVEEIDRSAKPTNEGYEKGIPNEIPQYVLDKLKSERKMSLHLGTTAEAIATLKKEGFTKFELITPSGIRRPWNLGVATDEQGGLTYFITDIKSKERMSQIQARLWLSNVPESSLLIYDYKHDYVTELGELLENLPDDEKPEILIMGEESAILEGYLRSGHATVQYVRAFKELTKEGLARGLSPEEAFLELFDVNGQLFEDFYARTTLLNTQIGRLRQLLSGEKSRVELDQLSEEIREKGLDKELLDSLNIPEEDRLSILNAKPSKTKKQIYDSKFLPLVEGVKKSFAANPNANNLILEDESKLFSDRTLNRGLLPLFEDVKKFDEFGRPTGKVLVKGILSLLGQSKVSLKGLKKPEIFWKEWNNPLLTMFTFKLETSEGVKNVLITSNPYGQLAGDMTKAAFDYGKKHKLKDIIFLGAGGGLKEGFSKGDIYFVEEVIGVEGEIGVPNDIASDFKEGSLKVNEETVVRFTKHISVPSIFHEKVPYTEGLRDKGAETVEVEIFPIAESYLESIDQSIEEMDVSESQGLEIKAALLTGEKVDRNFLQSLGVSRRKINNVLEITDTIPSLSIVQHVSDLPLVPGGELTDFARTFELQRNKYNNLIFEYLGIKGVSTFEESGKQESSVGFFQVVISRVRSFFI
ncbi:TIM barrel protein [Nanoarchaeota archaeon]